MGKQNLTKLYTEEPASMQGAGAVTIFDGTREPVTIGLGGFDKDIITFGRDPENDIILTSTLASRQHGRFVKTGSTWAIEDKGAYDSSPSSNGLIYNNMLILRRILSAGDCIRIDAKSGGVEDGVLMVFSEARASMKWKSLPLDGAGAVTIGRDPKSSIVLPHISVSRKHAEIVNEAGRRCIVDNGSTNGVIVNNHRISGKFYLHEKDIISITNARLIYTSREIYYYYTGSGITVDAQHIIIKRDHGKKVTCDDVSLTVKPGELVAIIGGSGAGKSTIMNAMSGYLPPTEGDVYINGIDLYDNYDSLKTIIGYVPQADIVYDNLTIEDMLKYAAKLRLPSDAGSEERRQAIDKALGLVQLTEFRSQFIRRLSGGQKKRASIAVELLSDPNLLFLDEPASGLDPGTERSLMESLRKMADSGKTVVLVTHSTLQLALCDKVAFMGKGGKLCYYGSLSDALHFFGVTDVVDIYRMITDKVDYWSKRYREVAADRSSGPAKTKEKTKFRKKKRGHQLGTLCARYAKLVINDRQRLLLLLVQAPLLAYLISLVADGNQFERYEMTKSLLFALSCAAFWVGMLNSIQEICKERTILRREYKTGLSLTKYLFSKVIILGILCAVQSAMIMGVFAWRTGLPDDGVQGPMLQEMMVTTFLTALAAAAMGLFISALFNNADRAMTVAPIMLMPQILFSGMIFSLSGITETISYLAVCRWSMEGYGTSANLNDLPDRLISLGIPGYVRSAESFYEFTAEHLYHSWGALAIFCVACLVIARIALKSISGEKS